MPEPADLTVNFSHGVNLFTIEAINRIALSSDLGIATATDWLANFIIGTVVPQMLVSIGWGTSFVRGVVCGRKRVLFHPRPQNLQPLFGAGCCGFW